MGKKGIFMNSKIKRVLVAIGLGLLVLLGWMLVKYYWLTPQEDKESFSIVERSLDQAMGQIVSDSAKVAKEKSCSRAKEKYGYGSLVCSIKIHVPVKDALVDIEGMSNVFDSISTFQKQGLGQGQLRQYSYEDISCSIQSLESYYNIVCGAPVARAIY